MVTLISNPSLCLCVVPLVLGISQVYQITCEWLIWLFEKKKKKNVDVAVKVGCYWQPREAFLDQNHCHSFPGCLANLLVCWIFRICVWIMSLLGTSIWVLLYKMSSFTATDFISSWSCNDAGCFVAAISSCNLLLGVSVKIQSIIYLSVQISFRSWFLVARAVI